MGNKRRRKELVRKKSARHGLRRDDSTRDVIVSALLAGAEGGDGDGLKLAVPKFQFWDLFFWGNLWYMICCLGYVVAPVVADAFDIGEHVMTGVGWCLAALYVVSAVTFWRAYESTVDADARCGRARCAFTWNRVGEACSVGATLCFLVSATIALGGAHRYGWWKAARYCDGAGAVLYVLNSLVYWFISVSERQRVDRRHGLDAWWSPGDTGYWSDVTNLTASVTALCGWVYSLPYLNAIFETCDVHVVALSDCWTGHAVLLHPQFANVGAVEAHANVLWLLNSAVSFYGWQQTRAEAARARAQLLSRQLSGGNIGHGNGGGSESNKPSPLSRLESDTEPTRRRVGAADVPPPLLASESQAGDALHTPSDAVGDTPETDASRRAEESAANRNAVLVTGALMAAFASLYVQWNSGPGPEGTPANVIPDAVTAS